MINMIQYDKYEFHQNLTKIIINSAKVKRSIYQE